MITSINGEYQSSESRRSPHGQKSMSPSWTMSLACVSSLQHESQVKITSSSEDGADSAGASGMSVLSWASTAACASSRIAPPALFLAFGTLPVRERMSPLRSPTFLTSATFPPAASSAASAPRTSARWLLQKESIVRARFADGWEASSLSTRRFQSSLPTTIPSRVCWRADWPRLILWVGLSTTGAWARPMADCKAVTSARMRAALVTVSAIARCCASRPPKRLVVKGMIASASGMAGGAPNSAGVDTSGAGAGAGPGARAASSGTAPSGGTGADSSFKSRRVISHWR
mmetsp:Transcript_985/g.2722  ORF Transcript_985/g.2722 Transcript_985/m.2722 type:complete len:288 (-) Transcript_985:870-1733(-)